MTQKRNIQAIIKKANDYVNAKVEDTAGLKRHLTAWYCFNFNTTFKDPTFLSHTFEELLLLYFMFKLKENPDSYRHITHAEEARSYEDFLKNMMGEDYVSEDQMVEQLANYDKKEKEYAATLPDIITTDFSNLGSDINE